MDSNITLQTKQMIDSLKAVCTNFGLGNASSEYKIITEVFLYKFLNDKFLFEAKRVEPALAKLSPADAEKQLAQMTDDDYELFLLGFGPDTAKLKQTHFISYLFNRKNEENFHTVFDDTLLDIATYNIDIFSVRTGGQSKMRLFSGISQHVIEAEKKDDFCRAIIDKIAECSFDSVFEQKYDFFAQIFEYLIKDYNKDFGKYAEYYERDYLKVLCDEVFGRSSFLASIVWQKRYSRENREAIGDSHEYILVYVKDKDAFKKARNYLPLAEKQLKAYKNPDNDPRGAWQSVSLLAQGYRPNQMYEIVAPNGKVHTPPPGNCWKVVEPEFKKALADGRVTFGSDGNGVPRRKQFLSEAKGIVPWTWWPQDEVGHTGESKDEVNALFGSDISFDTPKPERLIERIIHIASNPGDLVLDSFLGSGTTAAVAQKMGRRWIGVEMGNHAYTHCKVRMDKVIAGEDPGGITKAQNWQGGGGYRFYEVAPTLINKDSFDEYVINEDYDANMLAAAVALHEGFRYHPDGDLFWKQSVGNENSYLFVTTRHLNSPYLDSIKDTMEEGEYLIIACRSFDSGLDKAYDNITVKKIPQMLLERCEFGKADYNLNIVHPPVYDDCDEEEEDV